MGVKENLFIAAGVFGILCGITAAIPAFFKEQYILAVFGVFIMMLGLILIAIAFGDEDEYKKVLKFH